MSDVKPEIGVECSCGFHRRATQIANGGTHWNGREIEALHLFQIQQEAASRPPMGPLPTHSMSMGLFATMDWLALTGEEHRIGEAWLDGHRVGVDETRARIKQRLAAVVGELSA